MNLWIRVHQWHWMKRWVVKGLILTLTVLIVCFPHPVLLARHLGHWSDPNAMIEPESAAINPLIDNLMGALPLKSNRETNPEVILKAVEREVYLALPYAYDWETWGMADYFPTVEEAMGMGREDCDGRAVVGASVLARMGFEARLVTDGAHVWVSTPEGDAMGPGKVEMVRTTKTGVKMNWRWLGTIPRIMAVNAALFPLLRELVITVVLCALMLHPRMVRYRMAMVGVLLFGALFLLRYGGDLQRRPPVSGWAMLWVWGGIVALVLAVVASLLGGRRVESPGASLPASE